MDIFRKRVKENIEKSLRQKGIQTNIEIINGNIRINGIVSARIRLTVIPTKSGSINEVDVNNIQLDNSYTRCGIFTLIMKNLKQLKTVDRIKVSSVCSESMLNWCKKNNCKQIEAFDFKYK